MEDIELLRLCQTVRNLENQVSDLTKKDKAKDEVISQMKGDIKNLKDKKSRRRPGIVKVTI